MIIEIKTMMLLRSLQNFRYSIKTIMGYRNRISIKFQQSVCPLSSVGQKNLCNNMTVKDIITYWRCRFEDDGISEPDESIKHIISHVMKITKCLELISLQGKILSEEQLKELEILCLRRLSRMPVQYIIGEWTFRDITVKLVPPIFIPRPETEMLVDFVGENIFKNHINNSTIDILEIGCGSGAISLAILNLCKNKKNVKCIAIDQNLYACQLAKDNAKKLEFNENHIRIMNATIDNNGKIMIATDESIDIDFSTKQFDIIVSNPPYIPTEQISKLPSEIKIHEDIRALDGGIDGLNIIKSIIKYSSSGLKPCGQLFMEVDSTHPKLIQFFVSKFWNMELIYDHTYKDFYNNDRFVEISKIS